MSDASTRRPGPGPLRPIVDADRFFRRGRSLLGSVVPIRAETDADEDRSPNLRAGLRITPTLVLTLGSTLPGTRKTFSIGSSHGELLWSSGRDYLWLLRAPPHGGALPELTLQQASGNISILYSRMQGQQCVAFGSTEDGHRHDALVSSEAMGAPVFDEDWSVVGLHERIDQKGGVLVPMSALLRDLEDSPHWDEIASLHRLVRTAPKVVLAAEPPSESLERAVRWDPDDEHPISERERRRALQGGSLAELRAARGSSPATGPEQRAIDAILAGPPFDLEKLTSDELLSFATASRWFEGIVPELPGSEELERTIHRRRRLSALDAIIGSRFAPRTNELNHLHAWLRQKDRPPLVVKGPGGIGKSALIASFVKDACPPARFAWLDFDRPDVSVDEAAIQRVVDEELSWQSGEGPVIVVLDSFETSVQTYGYTQLNPALDALARRFPDLGILVGTRASVPLLKVEGQPAQEFELAGLERPVATRWLMDEGIAPSLAGEAAALTRGVPLNLRLTRDLLAGKPKSEAHNLLADLPSHLVTGYLYRRILRRLNDESLKQPVQWTMVPRRLTPELLEKILDVPADEAQRLFEALRREVTLLEGDAVLSVRADLRHTLLPLLEAEDGARVRAIDEIAAQYWAERASDDRAAAEAVYHFLRLSKLSRAEELWRRGIESHLRGYAMDELPAESRAWLQSRVAHQSVAEHVEDLLARGQLTEARAVLSDQPRAVKSASLSARRRMLLGFLAEEERPPDAEDNLEDLEAIVLKVGRPIVRIRDGKFGNLGGSWNFLEAGRTRSLLERAIAAVGQLRIGEPGRPSGTAVLVGHRLFMTTRSAIASCVVGFGVHVRLIAEQPLMIDLRAEGSPSSLAYRVERCVLIHPYWDVALLEISEPGEGFLVPLELATTEPPQDSKIVTIGHPTDDPREEESLKAEIFNNEFDVKRLMPGQYMGRQSDLSFGREVLAARDDSMSLGGDSGAAVVDPRTGALLGIRFSAAFLRGNSSVPAWELARDPEMAKAGVRLAGRPAPPPDWVNTWSVAPTTRQQLLDAYVAWRQGDIARARTLLELLTSIDEGGWADRVDKMLLEAACFIESDRGRSGKILELLISQKPPIDQRDMNALVATRLRLAVDAEAELMLLRSVDPSTLQILLAPTRFRVIAPPWTRTDDVLSGSTAELDLQSLGLSELDISAVERVLSADGECRRLTPWVDDYGLRLVNSIYELPMSEARAHAAALVAFPRPQALKEASFLLEKLDLAPHPSHGWTPILEPLLILHKSSQKRRPEFASEDALMEWLKRYGRTGRLGASLQRFIQVDTPVAWVAGLFHLLTPLPIESVLERHFTETA